MKASQTSQAPQTSQLFWVFGVCVLVSFGLSLSFWLFWGVFQLFGFILWSLIAALAGLAKFAILRHVLGGKHWAQPLAWFGAIGACVIVRIGIFALAMLSV